MITSLKSEILKIELDTEKGLSKRKTLNLCSYKHTKKS